MSERIYRVSVEMQDEAFYDRDYKVTVGGNISWMWEASIYNSSNGATVHTSHHRSEREAMARAMEIIVTDVELAEQQS